jgi:predicted acyl esterase
MLMTIATMLPFPSAGLLDAAEGPSVETLMVPMRDGVRLATDVYTPSPGATGLPCLLVRTPYGRTRYAQEFGSMARWGYAVAIQDLRGRFDSEGKAMAFDSDGWGREQDGYDTVEWLARQQFCNGRVGTLGASAMGITQVLLAPTAPPHLVCQHISVAPGSLYHHAAYVGGVLRKDQVENYLRGQAHPDALKLVLDHPDYDDFWQDRDAVRRAASTRAPAVHYGGWYDTFLQGTIDTFCAWQGHGGPGARGRQKLVLGPWTHGGPGKTEWGDFELPQAARHTPDYVSARRWFDHYLKGVDNGAEAIPAATYYVMGPLDGRSTAGNRWATADAWPPPGRTRPFYFAADGALSAGGPPDQPGSAAFTYDPNDPTPTVGGRNLYLPAGPKDQRAIERRSDVVAFTSPPLGEDLEVTGRVTATVFVSAGRPEAHAALRLCDVYPDGRSILIAEGIRRLPLPSGRDGAGRRLGGPVEVEVDLWSTSIVLAKGHRIRVSVAGANYPRWQAAGASLGQAVSAAPFRMAVDFGREHPSRLLLPEAGR